MTAPIAPPPGGGIDARVTASFPKSYVLTETVAGLAHRYSAIHGMRDGLANVASNYLATNKPIAPFNAISQIDRVHAEQLIRSTALSLANGSPIRDIGELVSRNASSVTHADLTSGRLPQNILGDIIGTVEQAKGSAPFNWSSATPAQISNYLAAKGLTHLFAGQAFGNGLNGMSNERGGSERASSARYDNMAAGNQDWSSDKGQAYMRQFAMDKGLGWAAHNPDLLRLGPAAVQALADVKLKQESYDRLTKKFELTPKETVQTAVESKKRGVDLNSVSESADRIDQHLPPEQRPEFRRRVREFLPKMNDPKAQKDFNGKINGWKKRHPHLAPEMEQLQKDLKIEQKSNTLQHRQEAAVASDNQDLLAEFAPDSALKSRPPAANSPPQQQTAESKTDQSAKPPQHRAEEAKAAEPAKSQQAKADQLPQKAADPKQPNPAKTKMAGAAPTVV